MSRTHLSDDQLLEVSLRPPGSATPDHLVRCGRCEARRRALSQLVAEVHDVAAEEADAAFPPDRLLRQQARILQRIDQDGRPARVITFPAGHQQPLRLRSHPTSRWVAAAAAAGLVVGLLAGHLVHDLPQDRRTAPAVQQAASAATQTPGRRTVAATISDDEFLGQVELAVGRGGPLALRPLDALTPRAWEVASR